MKDKVLATGVTNKSAEFYQKLGADLVYSVNHETAHPMPTDLPDYSETDGDKMNKA